MPITPPTLKGKVPSDVETFLRQLAMLTNQMEAASKAQDLRLLELRAAVGRPSGDLSIKELSIQPVVVDPDGAINGNGTAPKPLAVRVDGTTVTINVDNELEATGGGGSGITQLTGDVTAGPGSGSQVASISASGVTPGTYGDATNVGQFTVGADGRLTFAQDVAISFPAASGLYPVQFLVGDGENVIAIGASSFSGAVQVAGTIIGWTLASNDPAATAGQMQIDVWKSVTYPPTNGDSITGGDEPALDASPADNYNESFALGAWTDVIIAVGDFIGFYVDSNSGVLQATLTLWVQT